MIIIKRIKYFFAKALKILLSPAALNNCEMDKTSKVCSRSELTNCHIERYTYVGYQNFIVNASIGSFCSIGDRCSIGGAMHRMEYVSTSPVFCEGKNVLRKNFSYHKNRPPLQTKIGHDVWIGQGAYIKAGIVISTGAIVGMGSVVTHDIGPYEIWGGNPAKLIRKRLNEEEIEFLLDSKWWEWSEDRIIKYAEYFESPVRLMEAMNSRELEV